MPTPIPTDMTNTEKSYTGWQTDSRDAQRAEFREHLFQNLHYRGRNQSLRRQRDLSFTIISNKPDPRPQVLTHPPNQCVKSCFNVICPDRSEMSEKNLPLYTNLLELIEIYCHIY